MINVGLSLRMIESNDPVAKANIDTETPLKQQLKELYSFIDNQKIAMLATLRPDGKLVSRPMHISQRANGIDFWLISNNQSNKHKELEKSKDVNLSFYKDFNGDWASFSGTAEVVNDKNKIRELYHPMLRAWFPDQGDNVHTGKEDDPRISLIFIKTNSIEVSLASKNIVSQTIDIAKSAYTGEAPEIAKLREFRDLEIAQARKLEV